MEGDFNFWSELFQMNCKGIFLNPKGLKVVSGKGLETPPNCNCRKTEEVVNLPKNGTLDSDSWLTLQYWCNYLLKNFRKIGPKAYTFFPVSWHTIFPFAYLNIVPAHRFSSRLLECARSRCATCHRDIVFIELYIRLVLAKVCQLRIFLFAYLLVCQLPIFLAAYLGAPGEGVCQLTKKNLYI